MRKRKQPKNTPETSKRQWRTVIFDEKTGEITVLDKKGNEILKQEAVKITLDFEKRKMSIQNRNKEVDVLDFDSAELQVAYKYEGHELKPIK